MINGETETNTGEERFQIFGARLWRSVPSRSARQLICVTTSTVLTLGGVASYKKGRCETSPGRQSAGRFCGWSQAYGFDGRVGSLLTSKLAALLGYSSSPTAQSCALSHVVTMLGGLVGGGGLWRMGTGGQGVGDGHSPRHQPLHRSGNHAGGHAHHARRESEGGQEVISRRDKNQRESVHLRIHSCFSIYSKVCCCSAAGSPRNLYEPCFFPLQKDEAIICGLRLLINC